MGREEQIEEREVLASIFPEEITDISETSYTVLVTLDIPGSEDLDNQAVLLAVSYPPDYPDTPPELSITYAPNGLKPTHLSLPDDAPQLLDTLQEPTTDSLGAAMIFTLISTLKESTESLIVSRVEAIQAAKDKEAAQEEEKENAKFHGEAVTRESFLRWRDSFMAETAEKDEEDRQREEDAGRGKKGKADEVKLTGREMWERGLVGKVEDEGDEADVGVGIGALKVED